MKTSIKIQATYCLLLFASISFSQTPEGFETMKDIIGFKSSVKETIGAIKTISADFTQARHLSIFSKTIDSDGKMIFKTPGKLKWTYETPYNYEILIKDQSITINDEGKINNFNLSSSEKFSEINELILNSVTGKILEDNKFTTAYYESKTAKLVVLKPKQLDMSQFVSEIHIYVEPKLMRVSQLKIVESVSDYTLISFLNQILNEPIPDGLFN